MLLLLALLFGARTLVAQNGYQYFTVQGTGGDSGVLWVQLMDNATPANGYYATYNYGPSDSPLTAATALARNLYASYGQYGVLVSGNLGTTIYVQLSAATIKTIGNGYFSYVGEARQSPIQTMYIADDGFLSPVSTATPDPPPVVPSIMPTITWNADGSVTIGDNSSTSAPPLSGEPSPSTLGEIYVHTDPTTGQVEQLTASQAAWAGKLAAAALANTVTPAEALTMLGITLSSIQSTTYTIPVPLSDFPTDPSGPTGTGSMSATTRNADGSIITTTVNEDGSITVTTTPPPPSSSGSGGGTQPICTPFHF